MKNPTKPISKRKRAEILEQIANNKWDGSKDDFTLKYRDRAITTDKEIVIAYLKHDHYGLRFVDYELLHDKEVILTAMLTESAYRAGNFKGNPFANLDAFLEDSNPLNFETYLYWATDSIKVLCENYPDGVIMGDGVIEALKKAVELESKGHTIPPNISLISYLESLELANDLQTSLTTKAEKKQTKRLKI